MFNEELISAKVAARNAGKILMDYYQSSDKKIDFYSFSYKDFLDQGNKYISSNNSNKIYDFENLSSLCDKFNIKKNLIKPLY